MKKVLILILALFNFYMCQAYAGITQTSDADKENTQVLFVMLSKHAAINVIDKSANLYQLTLYNVNPDVIYFADRPARFSNHMDLTKFLKQWASDGQFQKVPPNAMMEAVRVNVIGAPSKTVSYAVVLKNPQYDGKNNQLTFTVKPISGTPVALPDKAHSDYVAIFIDDACLGCIGF